MNRLSGATRIVIIGGGFGGMYTAMHLQRRWRRRAEVHVTLVSRDNYFLMTPLLFEAGSGVLEPRHAVNPIRPLLHSARFVEAEVLGVDFGRRVVHAKPVQNEAYEIEYDHLVIAVGGTTNLGIIPGSEHGMTFKTLGDAIRLRNHAIGQFELADVEKDAARKRAMLTFVVIGGGLVGLELQGELTEFLLNVARLYPRVRPEEIHFHIIEASKRLAGEFDESLADYATDVLGKRGVRILTDTRVERIEPGKVHLHTRETIAADTILLCSGVVPSPIIKDFPLPKDKRGRIETEPTMRVKGTENVWAIGDCAAIPDPTGKPYPQLAQHALREAKVLAGNIGCALEGRPLAPFVYQTKGTLAALGHFKGIGLVMGIKIRGFLAWWVWRTYYLMQMPQFQRKLRIVGDWTLALLFKNDVVKLDMKPDPAVQHRLPDVTDGVAAEWVDGAPPPPPPAPGADGSPAGVARRAIAEPAAKR